MDRLTTAEETVSFGKEFAARVKAPAVVALRGELGAGKTTFVQGFLQGLGIQDTAQSPTFTYLQIYGNQVYHFDLYRLTSEQQFISLGFEEFLHEDKIVIIEWPERIESLLPENRWDITFVHAPNGRTAMVRS